MESALLIPGWGARAHAPDGPEMGWPCPSQSRFLESAQRTRAAREQGGGGHCPPSLVLDFGLKGRRVSGQGRLRRPQKEGVDTDNWDWNLGAT